LVGKKVRQTLGLERVRSFFCGAAPISLDTLVFFRSLGMPIIEGFGLTEVCGASHANRIDAPVFGTVGPALEGMECRIAADGEILLKGANVFLGYFKDEKATAECFSDGWFSTGDIGKLDAEGNLRITDRKKNIIVTAAGKNVAPAPIEAKLKQHHLVGQVVVIGDRKKYLTALFTLTPGLQASAEVRQALDDHVERVNATLSSYETIKAHTILGTEFTVETGELTPTLKTKRGVIQEKYRGVIDAMYESGSRANTERLAEGTR
jgi:long-subunit acyl-CoA synthetase (AMP-forming)